MSKEIIFGRDARASMKRGLDKLADAVRITLGPRGRHAAIEREHGPPLVTKDGVTVAKSISLSDPAENMGAQLIKFVASATNGKAGDGTTTATVLAQAIYSDGIRMIEAGYNPVLIKRGIDIAVDKVSDILSNSARKITDQETLRSVASISANNDEFLGNLISEVIETVGNDGVIYVDSGSGYKTSVEYTEGYEIGRGYMSQGFINNTKSMSVDFDNPFILCYDGKIEQTGEIIPILEMVSESGKPLLIIAMGYSDEVVQTLVLNKARGSLMSCAIKTPGFGDTGRDVLVDLSITCGTIVYNPTSCRLSSCTLSDLGSARKIVCNSMTTSIIDGDSDPEIVSERVDHLKSQMESTVDHHDLITLKQRLSVLTGGVALIKVGGSSEAEMEERKSRVEDAINAVKAAIDEGVVAGGGAALLHASKSLGIELEKMSLTKEELAGFTIVMSAMKSPFIQILSNAGVDHYEFMSLTLSTGGEAGYNALTNRFVESMIDDGVIDPVKVVRTALEHAASASGTLLTTEVSIFTPQLD
jgi:chaperonin GroEL